MALYGYVRKTRPAPWTQIRKTRSDALCFRKRVFVRPRIKSRSPSILRATARILRKSQNAQYRVDARLFIKDLQFKGAKCPVWLAIPEVRNARRYGWPVSGKITQCHHKFGRLGPLLLWKPGWIGVSKLGHRWIHQNIARARLHGWIAERGDWNNLNVILR